LCPRLRELVWPSTLFCLRLRFFVCTSTSTCLDVYVVWCTSTFACMHVYVILVGLLRFFTSTFACCTSTSQVGRPMPQSNACQLVLKYLLVNKSTFVKAYHDRTYSYSSGTIFGEVSGPLQLWITKHERLRAAFDDEPIPDKERPPLPSRCLKRLTNHAGLFEILADSILCFMQLRPQPFGKNALDSQVKYNSRRRRNWIT
jgi:hypothetical protein